MPTKRRTISRSPPPNTLPHPFYLGEKKWQSSEFFQSLFAALKVAFFQLFFFKLLSKHKALGGSNGYISPPPPCKCLPGIPFGLCSFSIILGPVAVYQKIIFDHDEMNELLGNLKQHFHCLKSCKDRVEKERKRDGNANAIIWQTQEEANE